MEERIRKFIEYKGITPSELADSIGVQRSNVTHVLKARNKPSFQFIEKMLQIYPELNAKWLLLGTGSMVDTPVKSRTLFDQPVEAVPVVPNKIEKPETISAAIEDIPTEIKNKEITTEPKKTISNHELQDQFFSTEKPIERLIIFFNDQTFKVYTPSK